MADTDLPVWSIPPNWSTPVVERLEFLTNVLASRSGAEQRRSVRLTPRRFFEFTINPVDRVRAMFDQWMHRLSDEKFLLPIWHDRGKLTAAAAAASSRLDLDTRWLECVDAGLALLFRDAFTYEIVEIMAVDDAGLDLTVPLVGDWPLASTVYPLKRSWLDPETKLSNLTSRVGDSTLAFMLDTDNPLDSGVEPLALHEGYPVVTLEPNRLDALEQQYTRVMDELDNQTGRVRRYDENVRSFQTQFYNWQAKGRQAHHSLRQALYRLNGRQKAIWMPSFNRDVVLASALPLGQGFMEIEKIGYHLLGGPVAGRDLVMLKDNAGTPRLVKVNGSSDVSAGVERLDLTAASTFAAAEGAHGSFVEFVRMDQDVVEIVHHTDSNGACEAAAAFRSVSPARIPPALLMVDAPEAIMSDSYCGPSTGVPCPIFITTFDGWDYEISALRSFTKKKALQNFYIHRPIEFGGAAGGGNAYGGALGSDFAIFGQQGNTPLSRWDARRVLIKESQRAYSMVGDWRATMDQGIVNRYGTPRSQLNYMTINLYARHWSEPWPGRLVYTKVTSSSATRTVKAPQIIDWRDFR